MLFFFFFKQKTAYEMRISDWSSDVCSSDLLVSVCARANNALRRLGSGWALFFDAERIEALGYPDSTFPDPASWLVDEERRAHFDGRKGQHFESRYHLTLCYLPPAAPVSRAERALLERDVPHPGRDRRPELRAFKADTDRGPVLLSRS